MQSSPRGARLAYSLAIPAPETHVVEVTLEITQASELGEHIDLAMATWSPGSYIIRDYARYVRHVKASDGKARALAVVKTGTSRWQIARGSADVVIVTYQVYGHDLSVRTNHIDDTHAFLHGPATYLYPEALRDQPCRVDIVLPEGCDWYTSTGLETDGYGFVAADIDELLDCPIHIGASQVRAFTAAGVPVHLVLWGDIDSGGPGGPGGIADLDRLATDLTAIIETHAERLGGSVPYRHYTFLLMLTPGGYGGLEHRNSSANIHTPFALADRASYEGLLELLSHEFFHVWNGKRIYPEALARFDYGAEMPTRCLWVVEGITSYYDRYTLLHSHRMAAKRYLEKLCEEWGHLRSIPGRFVQSLEEASYDAWIKLYKPDECNLNTTVSYYLKGGIVALALDLTIRRATGGSRSLADVLRLLWREYGAVQMPYPEDVQAVFERAAGIALGDFFARYIRGREELDMDRALSWAGLSMHASWDTADSAEGQVPVWLGITLGKGLQIAGVLDGSPAARGGLSPGDELIALDTWKLGSDKDLRKRLASRRPATAVELALFRRNRLHRLTVLLEQGPANRFEIVGLDQPTPEQRDAYRQWLGEEHPGAGVIAKTVTKRWL